MPGGAEAFQYAVWRVVPSLPRGERVNVGVVLFCRRARFLDAIVDVDEARVRAIAPDLDLDAVRAHLEGLVRVARGEPDAGPVAAMEPSDRFGYLTAPASTVVQPGEVHVGLCTDPASDLRRLADELVR
ncbi:DUF3037 domain-containing protein [Conexibacter sp. SYSU D00693]|uniref:DUF3037 domain-containing protein n=1 Tax=Conexibacter sp. SYSU D00693 TaxID=2812560 RepID=UPI00196A3EDD|nr:DUF3037 domain-containing protein [Conexibacter sp. SYSU D00693]